MCEKLAFSHLHLELFCLVALTVPAALQPYACFQQAVGRKGLGDLGLQEKGEQLLTSILPEKERSAMITALLSWLKIDSEIKSIS